MIADTELRPNLFGLQNSNRDFTYEDSWGKNQFNSSFPAALCNYIASKGERANYICIKNKHNIIDLIAIEKIFGTDIINSELFYNFESQYLPFSSYIIGSLPRTDLVLQKNNACLNSLEIKLTALPDNTTCNLTEDNYGCELVVRPDTIVYLACSIYRYFNDETKKLIVDMEIDDWSEGVNVLPCIDIIISNLELLVNNLEEYQSPFLLQPIWKTKGKKAELADHCLDIFAWSDVAFLNFITKIANKNTFATSINRQTRTAIWLYKMLLELVNHNRFNPRIIIDKLAYNTKNDKAFASSGRITNQFMKCERLINPLIHKSEIKRIILGGGQNLLSPERRFDAIIVNSPDLF